LSREISGFQLRGADAVDTGGRLHRACRQRETREDPARSEAPSTHGSRATGGGGGGGKGPAKGNSPERNAPRTQSRAGALGALEQVRQAAEKDRRQRFTALLHHVYDIERLRAAYSALKRDADGRHYVFDLWIRR
jgi:hypothetical protein